MLFGKFKDSDDWWFSLDENIFETYKEIDDDYHMRLIDEMNTKGKSIKGDKDGNPILVDPPPPAKKELDDLKLHKLKEYLYNTDWYAIRFADEGTPIPEEIKKKRAEARIEISEIINQRNL